MLSAFADVSTYQLLLVAGVALFASVLGGVAGYGTGALMPLILVPMVGAETVVPIIALAGMLTNTGRMIAFWKHVEWHRALIVLAGAVPPCVITAYGYTMLTGKGAQLVIGTMLMLTVPLRYALRRRAIVLSDRGLLYGSIGYGTAVGGTVGRGRDPAVAADGGGLHGPGGDRDRRDAVDRDRHLAADGVRICRRADAKGDRLCAPDRGHRVSRRVSRPRLRQAHAAARAHRDPRRGGADRRRGDGVRGAREVKA